MADEGLLVNFSLDDGILGIKPVFRGGRWKDRLRAKKSVRHREQRKNHGDGPSTGSNTILVKEQTSATATEPAPISTGTRPQKRRKLNDSTASRPKLISNEIISSLFTSNPTSQTPAENHNGDVPPAAPSNAPLLNSLYTFTSLGLSPVLATHLLSKLSLTSPTAIQKSAISQLLADDSDAFIQAETGSGKTLAYLLPIVQRIMQLSSPPSEPHDHASTEHDDKQVNRASGLFAIILAPTRELCKQISTVLESILRCAYWIVAGTVVGGEKKKSEKARLRKGVNILVATPGRLADHLENTKALDVSRVRWLILDEGDRLMELGFEEAIRGIVSKLEERSVESEITRAQGMPNLPSRRTTVMCSATMKMTVHRLGEISLRDAVHIKAASSDSPGAIVNESSFDGEEGTDVKLQKQAKEEVEFLAPAQLQQSYAIVPPKQRLVTLVALLKRLFTRKGSVMKAIVFLSCADSVDFHFAMFGRQGATTETAAPSASSRPQTSLHPDEGNSTILDNGVSAAENHQTSAVRTVERNLPSPPLPTTSQTPTLTSAHNPHLALYKLHGSLPQPLRTATLAAFTRSSNPCILLCTDVASRGLDLPNIDIVVEYDPPFNADDHLHRIGRTARAGREGRAVIFLMPGAEEGYVNLLKRGYRDGLGKGLKRTDADEVMKKGFEQVPSKELKGSGERGWEKRATDWQLEAERWVVENQEAAEMARKAFVSHVRAYATHVATEREFFDVKKLHLGHLAKAFALRERPGQMGRGTGGVDDMTGRRRNTKQPAGGSIRGQHADDGRLARSEGKGRTSNGQDAASRMKAKMKEHMAIAGEFNIG